MLHEQGRERTREREQVSLNQRSGSTARENGIAFASGLLLSFLTANSVLSYLGQGLPTPPFYDVSFPPWTAWFSFQIPIPFFLLLPLALGIFLPFTGGGILRKNLISFAFVRSSLVWAGVCIYWFPLAVYEDPKWDQEANNACNLVNNHGFCRVHLGATGFFYFLFFSYLLLLLVTFIFARIIVSRRKYLSNHM